jgi:predicted O-methyltransferase YrrM
MYWNYQPSVPWVPTRDEVIKALVSLLNPSKGSIIYDIGCGDGRVAIAIAKEFPHVRVKCIEARKDLVEKARKNVEENKLSENVDVIEGDFFKIELKDANIIYMYLLTSVNQKLRPKLEEELREGTVIISLDFPIPGWDPVAVIELPRSWQRVFYVYVKGVSDRKLNGSEKDKVLRSALSMLKIKKDELKIT